MFNIFQYKREMYIYYRAKTYRNIEECMKKHSKTVFIIILLSFFFNLFSDSQWNYSQDIKYSKYDLH